MTHKRKRKARDASELLDGDAELKPGEQVERMRKRIKYLEVGDPILPHTWLPLLAKLKGKSIKLIKPGSELGIRGAAIEILDSSDDE